MFLSFVLSFLHFYSLFSFVRRIKVVGERDAPVSVPAVDPKESVAGSFQIVATGHHPLDRRSRVSGPNWNHYSMSRQRTGRLC